jgi:hypothetical protein
MRNLTNLVMIRLCDKSREVKIGDSLTIYIWTILEWHDPEIELGNGTINPTHLPKNEISTSYTK